MSVAKETYLGPLFIVGMGRSGTKLLRDLLNQNPKIGIPKVETGFIPTLIRRFGNPPAFNNNEDKWHMFYNEFIRTNFYWYMKSEGKVLDLNYLESFADISSWSSIFEIILKFYSPKNKDINFIWGDKTGGLVQLSNIDFLKKIFPEAKILHIIRDPRDCCLSVRKTWGMSLYRSASIWREGIEAARINSRLIGQDYYEVSYEELIEYPNTNMRHICDFLTCDYVPSMSSLEKPSEFFGDARGQTRVVKSNKKKYLNQLSPSEIKRVEEIVFPGLEISGYNFEYDVTYKPLNPIILRILTLFDVIKLIKFHVNEKGLYQGFNYFLRAVAANGKPSQSH